MALEAEEPSHIALALLDYRVGEVEKRVETMGKDLTEVARQVTDIPGFIERKFQEQSVQIAARGKTAADEKRARWNLRLTTISASAAVAAAVIMALSLMFHLTLTGHH